MTPYIPENAPFSVEQRAWLNGLLAGLFTGAASTSAPLQPSMAVQIYFASQSGTAERLSKKLAKSFKNAGHSATVASVENVSLTDFAGDKTTIFIVSTYGEGDPPDNAKKFQDAVFAENAPSLQGMRYAVFCLGDRNYEYFCKFGADLDERLHALGGTRVLPRIESDVEVDAPFETWQSQLLAGLQSSASAVGTSSAQQAADVMAEVATMAALHTRENPYSAEVRERRELTRSGSSKTTVHVALELGGSPINYEAGDACGVIAQNDPALVSDLLAHLPFSGSDEVMLPKVGQISIEQALLHHLQFTRLTRKQVQAFAEKAECRILNALLPTEQSGHLDAYLYDRGLVDLLGEYPGVITSAEELVSMLPKLAPRLYSISSSPAAHGRELHCTIAVVRYRSHNRERGGVASTMLAERVDVGGKVPIYIQPNKRFRLPKDSATPMVMIGPGTGIAPFRSFLHERQALGSKGKNWLFFGERSAETDFLYCRELKQMCEDGHLTRFDTAFSRDQAKKIYVQDRMIEAGAELWSWLQDGAQFYVCGDASRMAKDVDAALHRVIETHGAMSPDAAAEYVSMLQEEHRYHRDVY